MRKKIDKKSQNKNTKKGIQKMQEDEDWYFELGEDWQNEFNELIK